MFFCKEMFEDNNIEIVGTCDKQFDNKGTPFVTLSSGGVKNFGETFPALFSSKDEAIKRFEDALLLWLNGRRRVYIRKFPEMVEIKLFQDSIHEDWKSVKYFNVVVRLTAY